MRRSVLAQTRDDLIMGFMLLTRLPMPSLAHYDKAALARSIWCYPLIGALVGAAAGAAFVIARHFGLSTTVASWIALAVMILTTGCFHEDALADFWDGIGGGQTIERKLEIMRDSRIGSYGATALILMFGCRVALITAIADQAGDATAAKALVAAGLAGRVSIAAVLMSIGPARSEGLTATAQQPPLWSGSMALGMALCLFALFPAGAAVAALCVTGGVAALMAMLMLTQIQGFTGDGLGATEVTTELAVLAVVAAASV